jgi:hypothetical protein
MLTGIVGLALSLVSLSEGRRLRTDAEEAARREYATEIVFMVDVRDKPGWRWMIENYSALPIQNVTISTGSAHERLGNLAPCRYFDVTSWVTKHLADRPDPHGTDSYWLTFTDARGAVWHRKQAGGPIAGPAPVGYSPSEVTQGEGGRAASLPLDQCFAG